jgi:uncharacterized protein YaaW (UPF0174 family)
VVVVAAVEVAAVEVVAPPAAAGPDGVEEGWRSSGASYHRRPVPSWISLKS